MSKPKADEIGVVYTAPNDLNIGCAAKTVNFMRVKPSEKEKLLSLVDAFLRGELCGLKMFNLGQELFEYCNEILCDDDICASMKPLCEDEEEEFADFEPDAEDGEEDDVEE